MSHVNFLEKLLDGVIVEWKALKDLTFPTKNIKWREAKRTYRYIDLTSVSIETKAITETIEISSDDAPSRAQKIVEKNDVIFATTRPTQKRYCLIGDQYSGEIASTGYCVLRAKQKEVLPKWIWHWIASSKFNKYVEENQSGSAYPAISDAKVKEFEIPIPCQDNPKKSLEIQAEIVRILDAMTAHTAELTAELTARKKQYNYYRDKLLSFEDGEVEWKSLGDMAFICDGTHQTPTYTQEGVPFVSVENIKNISASKKRISFEDFEKYKYKPQKNDLLMTRIGDIGSCAIVNNDNPLAYYVTLALIRLNQEVMLPKYLKYVIESHIGVRELRKRTLVNASPIKINLGEIGKIILPVPSTKEQARIVTILDKFDALTASITEGLPREIELRQKQYAYYRDLLLSFPQAQAA